MTIVGTITPNANPVVLNANGEADIILAAASTYKIVLKEYWIFILFLELS